MIQKSPEAAMAEKNLILKFEAGSFAYGTQTATSDRDYLGVFVPDEKYVLGLRRCEQVQLRTNPSDSGKPNTKDDVDTVLYSLPKYLKLLADNNPTILETLFFEEKSTLFSSPLGKLILQNADLFVSKEAKNTFLGYASSQKNKLFYKKDRLEEFARGQKVLESWKKTGHKVLPQPLKVASKFDEKGDWKRFEKGMNLEDVLAAVSTELQAYGHRTSLLHQFDYDVKFASHLVRLLDEGIQLLTVGRIIFPLPPTSVVRDIKLGKYTLDQVMKLVEERELQIETACVRSSLPNTSDLEKVDALQIRLLKKFWGYS